ncbi:peroxisome proliferator-activated receptor gamma coactivator-related protein 1 [Arapaima gigas]
MAARWGAADETITAGTTDYFSAFCPNQGILTGDVSYELSLSPQLDAGEALDPLHACLDSSILSIFEDSAVTGESKGRIDDEGEAALLTALTEILDNVDGENLSPFDTLPDSELFSGQKGRETSPLRRLLNLTRSPPEKDSVCIPKAASSGKAVKPLCRPLSAPLQRSDGEEEDDVDPSSLVPGSEGDALFPGLDIMELDTVLTAEQDWDHTTSMSLGELVKHMHPYCLAVSLELDEVDGEAVLPEGGIVLEVVDRGEQGEPILAVASTLPAESTVPGNQPSTSVEAEIPVVNGLHQQDAEFSLVKKDEDGEASEERPKRPMSKKSLTRRRKKRKSKAVKKRVPGSKPDSQIAEASAVKVTAEQPEENKSQAIRKKKKKVTFAPVLASVLETTVDESTPPASVESPVKPEDVPFVQPSSHVQQEVDSLPEVPAPSVGPMSDGQLADAKQELEAPQQEEMKPKSLSLEQYRLLRQQKKLAPVEKPMGSSTKWPTLPELPKELPPIPCLLEPKPLQDPRRASAHCTNSAAPQNTPVWQPKGSKVPPTPEALLVPPESVVARSKPSVVPALASKSTGGPLHIQSAPLMTLVGEAPPVQPAPLTVSTQGLPQNAAPMMLTTRDAHVPEQHPGYSGEVNRSPPNQPAKLLPTVIQTTTDAAQWQQSETPVPEKTPPMAQEPPVVVATVSQPVIQVQPDPMPCVPSPGRPQRAVQQKVLGRPADRNPAEKLGQLLSNEIGIEASDLTSLLEQFEETQAKEEQTVPEVCGKAATVGNSGKPVERVIFSELASTAGLTPPATPPHQTWKPQTPVALLGKPKSSPPKAIQIINPRPLPPSKVRGKPLTPVASTTSGAPPHFPVFADHDYCLPSEGPAVDDQSTRLNIKQQQPATVLQPLGSNVAPQHLTSVDLTNQPLDHRTQPEAKGAINGSVLLSPDTSPSREEAVSVPPEDAQSNKAVLHAECSDSPPVQERGRTRRRYRARLPRSSSSSSSRSRSHSSSGSQSRSSSCSSSPPRKRFRSRSRSHRSASSSSCSSRSSSCSSSRSRSPARRRRGSYSSSRSGSWSRSRSRSPQWTRRSPRSVPKYRRNYRYKSQERIQNEEARDRKLKAIEERRVVYVGRIRGGMTRKELKERFSLYGEIEDCTLHFREHGDNYGFVTYYKTKDAFEAIEHGSKLRQCNELPFDLCFGGRRQFCKSSYADLDSNREYDPVPAKSKFGGLDFDTLLKQAQKSLKR